jgi:hypothetical protein
MARRGSVALPDSKIVPKNKKFQRSTTKRIEFCRSRVEMLRHRALPAEGNIKDGISLCSGTGDYDNMALADRLITASGLIPAGIDPDRAETQMCLWPNDIWRRGRRTIQKKSSH